MSARPASMAAAEKHSTVSSPGSRQTATPAIAMKPRLRFLITVTVMLGSSMQAIDNTIANVALPHIQGSLSATQDQMTWVLTSYIVVSAIMTPLSGWLSMQIGRRRVLLASLIGFTIASACCGFAQSLPEIVISRVLQGISGAALVPLSQAVLLDINPPEKHGRAMAVWAMAVTVGPILGPALGGWLTENHNWRWVFYINVPIGILSILGTMAFVSETPPRKSRFDFMGFVTLSLAIGLFQMMLDRGQLKDWFSSTEIWVTAVIGAVSLYLFIVHLLTTRRAPFINTAIFKDRNFMAASCFMFMIGVVLYATLALLPPLLQDLMGYPVILTGIVTAPRGIGSLVSLVVVQWILQKGASPRLVVCLGCGISAVALWQMTGFYMQMNMPIILWSGLLQGLGSGMLYVPLAALAFATLHPSLRNEGAAMFSLIRNIGSSVGISFVSTMLTRNTQLMHARLGENITPYLNPLHAATGSTPQSLAAANKLVTDQASMIAYINDFKMMMILTLCTLPVVVLLRTAKRDPNAEPVVIE